MTDERIKAFDPVTLLQDLESDQTRLEMRLWLLTVQDKQRALLVDRIRHLCWLAAAVRDGEFLSSNQLSEIVTEANHSLRELRACQERNTAEQQRLETELSELAEARATSRWTRLRHRLRDLLGQKSARDSTP